MKITGAEFRVLWVRRSWVGLSHLDSAERLGCRVVRANRLIEGEIVSLGPEGPDERREVVHSRIDPGYGPGPGYRIEEYMLPEMDPVFRPYFALVEPVPYSVSSSFYRRLPYFPIERTKYQVRLCRDAIEESTPFIEPLHRLGEIEWLRENREKALKYLWTGFRLGRAAIPPGFKGALPESSGSNLPLFLVATDLMKALAHFGREDEALEILLELSAMDKTGTYEADGLLVPLLLRAGRTRELAGILRSPRALLEHEFVRALHLYLAGREREAARSVCRGMTANPLMLTALLQRIEGPDPVPFREGPYGFGPDADLFAALIAPAFRERGAFRFLAILSQLPWFQDAWMLAAQAARESDAVLPMDRKRDTLAEFRRCFSEEVVESTAREFTDSAFAG